MQLLSIVIFVRKHLVLNQALSYTCMKCETSVKAETRNLKLKTSFILMTSVEELWLTLSARHVKQGVHVHHNQFETALELKISRNRAI